IPEGGRGLRHAGLAGVSVARRRRLRRRLRYRGKLAVGAGRPRVRVAARSLPGVTGTAGRLSGKTTGLPAEAPWLLPRVTARREVPPLLAGEAVVGVPIRREAVVGAQVWRETVA